MKKKILLIGLIVICLSLSVLCIKNLRVNSQKAPKYVGSDQSGIDMMPIDSLDALVDVADMIVIGEVVSEPQTRVRKVAPNDPIAHYSYKIATAQFKIDETLYGDPSIKEISFTQMGEAGKDYQETKVKNGEKYLLLVNKIKGYPEYHSVAAEAGIFKINSQKKVLSLSNQASVAKYDDKDLSLLKTDIVNIIKKIKNK